MYIRFGTRILGNFLYSNGNRILFSPLKSAFYVYVYITKTHLYNFAPLKPHFYIVKLGFTGVYIMVLISAQKYRLWVR